MTKLQRIVAEFFQKLLTEHENRMKEAEIYMSDLKDKMHGNINKHERKKKISF